jgi:hypothetical protein
MSEAYRTRALAFTMSKREMLERFSEEPGQDILLDRYAPSALDRPIAHKGFCNSCGKRLANAEDAWCADDLRAWRNIGGKSEQSE